MDSDIVRVIDDELEDVLEAEMVSVSVTKSDRESINVRVTDLESVSSPSERLIVSVSVTVGERDELLS